MRLEGTLVAFSLPDIFQLLSYTKKTGTLHLRREHLHGVVHLRDGAVTGARSDAERQALGRRLVGAGLVEDGRLADAVEAVLQDPACGLARALSRDGSFDVDVLRSLAAEQATDAVFDLLRWPDGEFAFVVDEQDPDDLGASLPVGDVVAEGQRRLDAWAALTAAVPSPAAVVSFVAAPAGDPDVSRDEWSLLSFVDGARTVNDLVVLSGRGEYVVVNALAGLVERGLLSVGDPTTGTVALLQRQQLLAALEGGPAEAEPEPASPEPVVAAPQARPAVAPRAPVIPERPEPFTASRRPDHAEEAVPALARLAGMGTRPTAMSSSVGSVLGAHALQPEPASEAVPAASPYIDRDPSVNKSLLLRLIAGVRGL